MVSSGANNVFLSFRGEDVRHSFLDHLYDALKRAGISTFRDNEGIKRGESVELEIERAIEESSASVVVFSANYATSTWCLDELVLILEQRREANHFVLPVFYHVDPSDVMNQTKTFVIEVKPSSRWTAQNVKLWKKALTDVANLAGLVLSGSETKFLKEIVDTIYNQLDCKEVSLPPNITGMATRYEEISSWLNRPNVEFLAICGMGGSGKTTLAKYIYNSNWKTFENTSFLEGIGRKCEGPDGLCVLQEHLLEGILGGKKRKIPSVSQGTCKIAEALQTKRSLIVLDDIAECNQLDALLGNGDINAQSKIIITTRESIENWFKSTKWRCQEYKMELLNDEESLELLSLHAFGSKFPMEGLEEYAKQAIRYCEGNPLALEVLASSLSMNNTTSHWESQLNLLEADIDSRIENVLIMSYNSLPHGRNKKLFLHIACFFVGKDMDYVVKILEHDYHAISGIKILSNKCLLSVSPNKKLMMHRLLQEMGKNIVRQESEHPAKRSRVWLSRDSYKILSKGHGSDTIEGLALDIQRLKEEKFSFKSSNLKTDALQKMEELKLLQLNFVQLTGSYENFSEDLRWLCWIGSHLRTIPSNLFMGNLVAIDMSYSNLEVFEPPMVLRSLQILNLTGSKNLFEIRNMSMIPRLETLILWNCHSLVHVCETIGDLTSLALLNMTGCKELCKSEQTDLLVGLEASTSSGVVARQAPLLFPRSLNRLFLKDCNLDCTDSFPLRFSDQQSLQYLNLVNSLFEFLPCYDHLKNLLVLDLSFCSRLKKLLCLPSTLAELYVYHCKSLEKISFQSHRFTLQEFGYEGCISLCEIEDFIKLIPVAKLEENDLGHMKWLKEYENHEVCLVGDDELTKGRSSCVQMLYEFNIMSTSLPDIKDPNMKPKYVSESSFLSFDVPLCPENKRLKGLDVTFKYTVSGADDWVWFCKISTTNGVDLMYNPIVFGIPDIGEVGIWLSYWPIGNTLDTGDEVNVSILVISGLEVHECGVNPVYTDDQVATEALENNMGWIEVLGGDLSGFQLSTGAYYLCRRDFFELMEVGRLTPGWFSILVGDSIECTEVRGWRKTGRPKQLDPSFTELKTVRCIIYGPEPEEIYKIPEMSKSSFVDKTLGFTSSLLEDMKISATSSEFSGTEVQTEPQEMAMLLDSLLSESISKLFEMVIYVAQTKADLIPELELLSTTLERIPPIIHEIANKNRKLDHSELEYRIFIEEINEAKKLVAKCSKLNRNSIEKLTYSEKLNNVKNKILTFFRIEVQALENWDWFNDSLSMSSRTDQSGSERELWIGSISTSSRTDQWSPRPFIDEHLVNKTKPQELAMLADPLLSDSISKLYEMIIYVAKTTSNFKLEMKGLSDTLQRIKPNLIDIVNMNHKLDRSEFEYKKFIEEIQEAEKLIRKCSKVKWNLFKKYTHSQKLKEVNNKMLRFFQIEVQAIQTRDITETLKGVNDMSLKVDNLSFMQDIRRIASSVGNPSGSLTLPWTSLRTDQSGSEILERKKYGWRVPALPNGIVAFDKPLAKLKAEIIAGIDIDADESSMDCDNYRSVLVVSAAAGCGKTTLVKMLCHDLEIQEIFGENIFFVTVSETPNLVEIVSDLFNPDSSNPQLLSHSNEHAKTKLDDFLKEKLSGPMLLVLDDVWSDSFIEENFPSKIRGHKILVTSRTAFPKYDVFRFDPLSEKDAKTLFHRSAFTPGGSRLGPIIDENLLNQTKPQEMAMFTDPLLSESISKLSEMIIYVAKTTANFKPELKKLNVTLHRITPLVHDLMNRNIKLDRTELEIFIKEIQEAEKLIRKCSKIKWNLFRKYTHSQKLKVVNNKILRFFQIEVQAIQTRDIMETLKGVNDLMLKMDSLSLDVQYIRRNSSSIGNRSGSLTSPWTSLRTDQSGSEILERKKYGWRVPALPNGIVAFDEPLAKLKAEIVAGIDDDESSMDSDYRSVLVVAAAGGCGKTTLVKMLCHDPEIQEIFGKNIFFVRVSETPNLVEIMSDLFNPDAPNPQLLFQSNEHAKTKLDKFLIEKISGPMLVVLDDVWSDSFIEENFPSKIRGHKILVTSRIAFSNYDVFRIDPLNEKDAITLLHRSAFTPGGRTPSPIIDANLVNQMVKWCNKHPLTLSVVGRSLNGKEESIWKSTLNSLSQGRSVVDLHMDVLTRLEGIFETLDDELKQCFLDFGLFPEDQKIPVNALLNMWVHLYNHDDDGGDTLTKIFELSHRKLVDLMITGDDLGARVNYCDQQFVAQHDLLRELAIHLNSKLPLAQRRRLIINARGEDMPTSIEKVQEPMGANILSISTGELFSSRWCNMKVPEVEVVVLNLKSKTYTLPPFLAGIQKVKILNITNHGLYPTEFNNSYLLGSLHNLTRIRLERLTINPSILSPVNLQKVSLIMCKLGNTFKNLNSDSTNILSQLVEIEIDYCQDLLEFPETLCNNVYLKKMSITNCNNMCGFSEEFGKLTNLEMLNLRSCTKLEKLPDSIWRLEKLSVLDISDCLSLSGLPEKMGKLGGLRAIYMKGCTRVHKLPESVEELSHLHVVCNEEIVDLWRKYSNVEIDLVEED